MIYSIIALSISTLILLIAIICCNLVIIAQVDEIKELQERIEIKDRIIKYGETEIKIHTDYIKKLESKLNN